MFFFSFTFRRNSEECLDRVLCRTNSLFFWSGIFLIFFLFVAFSFLFHDCFFFFFFLLFFYDYYYFYFFEPGSLFDFIFSLSLLVFLLNFHMYIFVFLVLFNTGVFVLLYSKHVYRTSAAEDRSIPQQRYLSCLIRNIEHGFDFACLYSNV